MRPGSNPERPSGVLVVDKPSGLTSHDAVDHVRGVLGLKRVGHTGTLDPFATGVLPLCLGKATKLARFLAEGEKVYRATVRLGFSTTTDDLTGEPLSLPSPVQIDRASLEAACRSLTGRLLQTPPVYSAKRVGGRRLYELARDGREAKRTPVSVGVHALHILEVGQDTVELEVRCSPGTYVRALARDLGVKLGVGGHLVALRRTRSGAFGLAEAVGLTEVGPAVWDRVLRLSQVLLELPAIRVGALGREALRHGRDLDEGLVLSGFPEEAPPRVRVLDDSGALLALAVPRVLPRPFRGLPPGPRLHPDVVLLE